MRINIVQMQIFDRFYRYTFRDEAGKLFFGVKGTEDVIPLIDFEAKSKKTRDSVIIKLLHKAENVAEELFDRVGVRFITHTRFDTLRIILFLVQKNIVVPHNNKPSRALNSIIDLAKFKEAHQRVLKMAIRNNLSEERFLSALEREIWDCKPEKKVIANKFSATTYQSIQFTCRHLIEYKNPFLQEFNELRKMAKNASAIDAENDLAKKILTMDMSPVARDIRFFYPYEIQVMDQEAMKENSAGDASHQEYKKHQIHSAMKRVFRSMIQYKGLALE